MEWLTKLVSYPILTTLIGAGVGVLIKSYIDFKKQQSLAIHKAKQAFIEKQLSEFYSPLYSRLLHDEAIWKLRTLSENLSEEEQDKIQQNIETEILLPNHKEMAAIISEKLYLAGYKQVPEMFEDYLRHVAAFRALRASGHSEAPSHYGVSFPSKFPEEIRRQTENLMKEYATMLEFSLNEESQKRKM